MFPFCKDSFQFAIRKGNYFGYYPLVVCPAHAVVEVMSLDKVDPHAHLLSFPQYGFAYALRVAVERPDALYTSGLERLLDGMFAIYYLFICHT
jgi:hypothetical protein